MDVHTKIIERMKKSFLQDLFNKIDTSYRSAKNDSFFTFYFSTVYMKLFSIKKRKAHQGSKGL